MLDRGVRCPLWVTAEMLADARAHFLSCAPEEGVGFLTEHGFIPLKNISPEPLTTFQAPEDAWVTHGPPLAVLHSHTNRRAYPSATDMQYQAYSAVPWAIFVTDGQHVGEPVWFGDSLPVAPLFERNFISGVFDCYSLIRDAFRLGKDALASFPDPHQRIHHWPYDPIVLRDYPRDDAWWADGHNLYDDFFATVGAEELDIGRTNYSKLRPGDVFFYKLGRTPVCNHAGVYVGGGLILHHVPMHPSVRAPLHLYAHAAQRWVRLKEPT